MGYYTLHKISIINKYNNIKNLEKLCDVIKNVSGYEFEIFDSYLFDENWNAGYGCKWYNFNNDIFKISEKLPKFKIFVEAKEENGNTWEICVKGGHEVSYNCEESNSDENDDSNEDEEEESDNENDVDEVDNNFIILDIFENSFKLDDNETYSR